MYYVDKTGVKNLDTGQIIEIGTEEWSKYKKWISEGNTPEFDPVPYEAPELIKIPSEDT